MLYNYSVTPLATDHFEERVADICDMVKRGIITMPIFSMRLDPEGIPVWNKADRLIRIYEQYRTALDAMGVPSGILVQASLGHGSTNLTRTDFRYYVNLTDGESPNVVCPECPSFLAHFKDVMRRLARTGAHAIMLDDDFRLMMRQGRGCACAYHMAEFNRRANTNITREELYDHLKSAGRRDKWARIFFDVQHDAIVNTAIALREAIDEVNPKIQGINCTSGMLCETVTDSNRIFAGKGNPTIVRCPNGNYAPYSIRGFSRLMQLTDISASKLKKHGIDILLAEADTLPFNRYGKSARYLHAHYTSCMLAGLQGAKHWLTRMGAYEPSSGKAYREILARHRGFYERLTTLAPEIKWVGCNSAFVEQTDVDFGNGTDYNRTIPHYWISANLEEMGLPFYFSENEEAATFLEGDAPSYMTDEDIERFFGGSVFLDADAAELLIARGFGDKLGVNVSAWDLGVATGESFDAELTCGCQIQKRYRKLTPLSSAVEVCSYITRREADGAKILAPAVTKYRRENGRLTVVYCGTPHTNFTYTEGFSFMNESRKAQFVSLLREAGALPVYSVGDEEICLRAGKLFDDDLIVCAYKMGIDPQDTFTLFLEKEPHAIVKIDANGQDISLSFKHLGNSIYEIDTPVETLDPLILLIR